ncbi:MAG TPA: ROK family protein, partial [Verrucomicrobiae bacterium]|nr:ROK family protein [Verrucomicrobiae bacterium]
MNVLGIDIGGTGIKGGVVDTATGGMASERLRYQTPPSRSRRDILEILADIVAELGWRGPVGCTFPGIIRNGRIAHEGNMAAEWRGVELASACSGVLGEAFFLNDADAAGNAEMCLGAGRGIGGTVVVLVFGTGLGSAVFADGTPLPHMELGNIRSRCGILYGHQLSKIEKQRRELSWKQWGMVLGEYLEDLQGLLHPDTVIITGTAGLHLHEYRGVLPPLQAKVLP